MSDTTTTTAQPAPAPSPSPAPADPLFESVKTPAEADPYYGQGGTYIVDHNGTKRPA